MRIYIISGCCGSGKSTVSKELVKNIDNVALISGDTIHDMLRNTSMEWEYQLKIIWQNILLILDNFFQNSLNVILDYIVEDKFELEQILSIANKYKIEVRYIVMSADADTIRKRLISRGDQWLVERALFLREKLNNDINNIRYLYEGSEKTIMQQVEDIVGFKIYN